MGMDMDVSHYTIPCREKESKIRYWLMRMNFFILISILVNESNGKENGSSFPFPFLGFQASLRWK